MTTPDEISEDEFPIPPSKITDEHLAGWQEHARDLIEEYGEYDYRLVGACNVELMLIAGLRAERAKVADQHISWERRCAEIQMNAFKWMKAHDAILAFIQRYPDLLEKFTRETKIDLPKPSDLPDAEARIATLEQQLAEAVDTISKLAPYVPEQAKDTIVKARQKDRR